MHPSLCRHPPPGTSPRGEDTGHQVDFYVIALDEHGPTSTDRRRAGCYPAEALAGTGTVNGRTVARIAPEWLVRFHTNDVDATDWADVSALCERFGIPVPHEYLRFR
jgi:hypothetical protein